MRSNYRPIGDYIQLVDERNVDLGIKTLLGLSISKQFIPSVANTVGTNMRTYKIIRKNQFACSTMQVRRDRKMPVALLQEKKLLPEYLMMWFSREEFDRQAEFLAVGGVRGTLEWEDFLEMELPIPSLEKQQEIVNEYNIIANRIKLNDQLNQKLEETAQAIYKHWFVDFEFPAHLSGTLSGHEGYKSSGGAMLYNDELDKEIPAGWEVKSYEEVFNFKTGKLNSNAAIPNGKYPFFTCSSETFLTNSFSFDCEALLLAGNNASAVYPFKYYKGKFDAYQRTYVITPKSKEVSIFQGYYEVLGQLEGFKGTSSGTATKFLTMKILNPLLLIVPHINISNYFRDLCSPLFLKKLQIDETNEKIVEMKTLLLSKMATVEAEKEIEIWN